MRSRILSILLVCCMLLTMFPITVTAASSGTCGDNVTWSLDDNGVLTISGTGSMTDIPPYDKEESVTLVDPPQPWKSSRNRIYSVVIEDGVTNIANYAFYDCKYLKEVTIAGSVKTIGKYAFRNCGLTHITIPEGVVSIGSNAFTLCSHLSDVSIPSTVSQIDNSAFSYCENFAQISVADGNSTYSSQDGVLFNKEMTTLISCPQGKPGEYTIPDSVTRISESAFSNCENLTSISIPNSVKTIDARAFYNCSSLTDISLPNGITSIGEWTFYNCRTLNELVFPSGITYLGNAACWNCESLTSITIPDSVSAIEDYAFHNCDKLADVYYGSDEAAWSAISIGSNNTNLTRATIHYNSDVEEAPSYVIDGNFSYLGYNNRICEYTYHYDESWFWNSSYTYQHDLTRMSLRVAMAAGDIRVVDGQSSADGAEPLKNLMSDLGFTYSEEYSHYPVPEYDSIGYGIGSKTITSPSGEEATLIMVAVRGSGYQSEWGGNFRIGTDVDHLGFRLAANQVIEGLKNYIDANVSTFKPDVKVWISGFSRAAATTNLVAAYLDDGNLAEIKPDNVFAFCFECPRNTKNTDVDNSKYSNIINIVNPNDLVTKVAMSSWGFSRYGKTILIPTRDTNSVYLTLKDNMKAEYMQILSYLENPSEVVSELTTDYVNQSDVLNEFVFSLGNALKNEEHYAYTYQSEMVEHTAALLGQGNKGGLLSLLDIVRELLASQEFELDNLISTVARFADGAIYAHNPELCMAWLDSLKAIDNTSENIGIYRKLLINCPVDITVYDSSGQIVAQIVDGQPQDIENGLSAYIDYNEQNVIILPANEEYTVKLEATDSGTVTYTITQYGADSGKCNHVTSYHTITVAKGDELYGTIENIINDPEPQYPLVTSDGKPIDPTVIQSGSEVTVHKVYVSSTTGGTASGGGTFIDGEYSKVTAVPEDNYTFEGWYIGDRLVSENLEYRFLVDSDTTITAVFAEGTTTHIMTYVEAVSATCHTTGVLAHWHCSECGKNFTDESGTTEVTNIVLPIDPDNHDGGTEIRNATDATYETEGYTGDTFCLGCGVKISSGSVIPPLTPSPSITPAPSFTPTPVPTATTQPEPTTSPLPSGTPVPTVTPAPSVTPFPETTASPTPTIPATPLPTATSTVEPPDIPQPTSAPVSNTQVPPTNTPTPSVQPATLLVASPVPSPAAHPTATPTFSSIPESTSTAVSPTEAPVSENIASQSNSSNSSQAGSSAIQPLPVNQHSLIDFVFFGLTIFLGLAMLYLRFAANGSNVYLLCIAPVLIAFAAFIIPTQVELTWTLLLAAMSVVQLALLLIGHFCKPPKI